MILNRNWKKDQYLFLYIDNVDSLSKTFSSLDVCLSKINIVFTYFNLKSKNDDFYFFIFSLQQHPNNHENWN